MKECCEACKCEKESQEHISLCKVILQRQNDDVINIPAYENIKHGTVKEKQFIAKQFIKYMKTIEKLNKMDHRGTKMEHPVGSKWPKLFVSFVLTDL